MESERKWLSSQAYKNLFPYTTSASILAMTILRFSYVCVFVYNDSFLTVCFVNSSPEVNFRIALI
jgi:hypothetical protein